MHGRYRADFLYTKRGYFYFQRRIPIDVQQHYRCDRIQLALNTKDFSEARRKAARLIADLEDQWSRFRDEAKADVLDRFLKSYRRQERMDPKPDEIMQLYLDRKGADRPKSFRQPIERAFRYMKQISGDRRLSQYERQDAVKLRDQLLARGMAPQSVKRNVSIIGTAVKVFIAEYGLPYDNVFANVDCGSTKLVKARVPLDDKEIRILQKAAMEVDDEPRWLLALISDTGMRLSEAAGLAVEDIFLDAEIPYVHVRPHPWRSLKTASSERKVPLVGVSLWAARRAVEASGEAYAFPSICDGQRTKGNSTSATLNKWMKGRVPGVGKVVHSLRHSMRDRLRAVECPSEVIDQIGGWTLSGVGQAYGRGYPLEVLDRWVREMASQVEVVKLDSLPPSN